MCQNNLYDTEIEIVDEDDELSDNNQDLSIGMESVLTSIKKMLGIVEEYTHFDTDLTMHINSVLSILNQIGVGPSEGFSIEDKEDVWTDFIPQSPKLEFVKSYVYMKVKLLFDPPISSAAIESTNKLISELEWRIQVAVDPVVIKKEVNQNE